MGKNDNNNRYDTNKRYADSERKKEKRIKNPISMGSKRSKEKDALRKVANKLSSSKSLMFEDDEDDFDFDFDDLED